MGTDTGIQYHQILTYSQAVSYLMDIPKFTSKHTLEETRRFLEKLGSPGTKLSIIHVAGTNGKGSVCAYLSSLLREAGFRTSLFTSPHLTDIRERFCVTGKVGELISEEDFLKAFLTVYEQLDWEALKRGNGYHPTFFEYLFFMGMLLFEQEQPDYCILETGLGGRLDATNVMPRKVLTIITQVGMDHMEYLGDTIEEIASEKAGILQREVPLVYWGQDTRVRKIISRKAQELQVSCHLVSEKDYRFLNFGNKSIAFCLQSQYDNYGSLVLPTTALYQMENAAIAVKALEVILDPSKILPSIVKHGLLSAVWPGRMEEVLPDVFIDGAHNEDGFRAFLHTVAADGVKGSRVLLFAAVADKPYLQMLTLADHSGLFDKIVLTNLQVRRSADLTKLKETFSTPIQVCPTVVEAFEQLDLHHVCWKTDDKSMPAESFEQLALGTQTRRDDDKSWKRIYMAGSLYLVGEIKTLLKQQYAGLA